MELVSFVAQNAATGLFGGMGVTALGVFMPRLIQKRFSSRNALPVEMRLQIQDCLNDYESLLYKAGEKYELLETTFALEFSATPFSALGITTPLEALQSSHKTHVLAPIRRLFSSNLKAKLQTEEVNSVLSLLENKTKIVNETLQKINQKKKVVDSQLAARTQMTTSMNTIAEDLKKAKECLSDLSKRFDSAYIAEVPEKIYEMEEKLGKAMKFFEAGKDNFFSSSAEIDTANKAYKEAKDFHEEFKEFFDSILDYQRTAIQETKILKQVLSLKDPLTPKDLRKKEAAEQAIYHAQTHVYDRGNPRKVMKEILSPVYAYLEA
ncbi:MAG: hypothetical protein H9W81_10170 [Enterococcus sp.]|nr:hypothetical protein [Enterococcus sp.]